MVLQGSFSTVGEQEDFGAPSAVEVSLVYIDLFEQNIQGGFFNWSGLKMTKSQPLKEFSELVLPKKRPRMKKV